LRTFRVECLRNYCWSDAIKMGEIKLPHNQQDVLPSNQLVNTSSRFQWRLLRTVAISVWIGSIVSIFGHYTFIYEPLNAVQYVGFFMVPLILAAMSVYRSETNRGSRKAFSFLLILGAAGFFGTVWFGGPIYQLFNRSSNEDAYFVDDITMHRILKRNKLRTKNMTVILKRIKSECLPPDDKPYLTLEYEQQYFGFLKRVKLIADIRPAEYGDFHISPDEKSVVLTVEPYAECRTVNIPTFPTDLNTVKIFTINQQERGGP